MKTVNVPPLAMSTHAGEVLGGMAHFYRLPSKLLLRVILESVLDAASEDGEMQLRLAEAARELRRTGHVPDCWLELEGARFEDGPDDSGLDHGETESPNWSDKQLRGVRGYAERSDDGHYLDAKLRAINSPPGRFNSLADVESVGNRQARKEVA